MQRLSLFLRIGTVLVIGVFVTILLNRTAVLRVPETVAPIASSTLSVVPQSVASTTFKSETDTATTTTAAPSASVPKKIVPPKATPAPAPVPPAPPVSAPVSTPIPPTTSESNAALDTAASAIRGALVNILCYVPVGSGLHSISGSGIIIDPKGIILTNAHVAQYFLLADRNVSCIIRTGSPASDRYEAKLIFISPAWLHANPTVLTQALPSGTGEQDFALLAITKSATTDALPSSFPSLPLATTPPSAGTAIVIASYGAQFLESSQIQSDLFPTVVFGSVKDVFTFGTNTIDVLALGGSVAAQEGSSGGGVTDTSGKLIGTITTSTVSGATDTRSLDAITASYIRAEYASETGSALDILLAEPTATAVSDFAPQIPALESIITAQLP